MNSDEARRLTAYMLATWPRDTTPEQVAVWGETFGPLDFGLAFDAMHRLKETKTFLPAHAELLQAYIDIEQAQARRAAAINAAQNKPRAGMTACNACGDAGVEWVGTPSGRETVLPCRVCKPTLHRDRAQGHHLPSHPVDTCDWPLCIRRRDDTARRKSLGHAFPPAPTRVAQMAMADEIGEF